MIEFIKKLSLISVLIATLFIGSANSEESLVDTEKFLGSSSIKIKYRCYDIFGSYDAWMDTLKEKNGWFKGFLLSFIFSEDKYDEYEDKLDCYVIEYPSGGAVVSGYLVVPKRQSFEAKYPTIIFNRGGNRSYGSLTFTHLFNYIFPIADRGNAIFASQYRGLHTDKPDEFPDEFGGKDVSDVINITKEALLMPFVDANRLYMVGQSRGAMMTYMSLKQEPLPIKAIATMGSMVDLHEQMTFRPGFENLYKKLIPEYSVNKDELLTARSAAYWVESLPDIPILLQHGDEDDRVNLAQVERFAALLERAQKEHKLIVYRGASHSLNEARKESIDDMLKWFSSVEQPNKQNID